MYYRTHPGNWSQEGLFKGTTIEAVTPKTIPPGRQWLDKIILLR